MTDGLGAAGMLPTASSPSSPTSHLCNISDNDCLLCLPHSPSARPGRRPDNATAGRRSAQGWRRVSDPTGLRSVFGVITVHSGLAPLRLASVDEGRSPVAARWQAQEIRKAHFPRSLLQGDHRCCPIAGHDLLPQPRHMIFHRVRAEMKARRDLPTNSSGHQKPQFFTLPRRQYC